MLKIPYQKLRLSSKGNLNLNANTNNGNTISRISRRVLQGIPVLSIFALVGILGYSTGLQYLFINEWFGIGSSKAYAEEGIMPLTNTSASLIVDNNKIKDTIFATNGEFVYASHKITVEATNVQSYQLTLSKTTGLSGPSFINDADNQTPTQMNNAWGYAFVDTNAKPEEVFYQTLNASNSLTGPVIDSNHNLSGSKQLIFGAKFGDSAASGTYHAEATLSLVTTPRSLTTYSITYNANGGTNPPNAQTFQSYDNNYTFTLAGQNGMTKTGASFIGWAESSTATEAQYLAGSALTLTSTTSSKTLYAVWRNSFNGITTMQDMTGLVCNNATIGEIAQLTDSRDSNKYTIRRHEDGKCWMTQNLRIINKTITSSDSNVASNFTIPATNTSGFNTYNTPYAYYSNNINYGTYYSWYTATAGTGKQATTSGDVTSSICPKGWRLPSSADYSGLATAIGAANNSTGNALFRNSTYQFQNSGYIDDGRFQDVDAGGFYWTRTAQGSNNAYFFDLSSGKANPSGYSLKFYGFTVRCVATS